MKHINYQASPGTAIIIGKEEKAEKGFITTQKVQGRIIKGQIVSMGNYDTTAQGEKILPERFGKEGDIVYFLHYYSEGGMDFGEIEGQKYYFVKWGDFRAINI